MLLACGEDDAFVTDVELEPRCGGEGAVKLLDLADDEEVGQVGSFDGEAFRVELLVGREDDEDDDYSRRSVVVSACGDDVQDVAPNLDSVFVWEGALLSCDRNGYLVHADALDDSSPTVLAERACGYRILESVIVAYDVAAGETVGRLIAIRSLGDGELEVDTLVEEVVVPKADGSWFPSLVGGEVFVRTPELDVLAVDVASGTSTILLDDVVSASVWGSQVLYQSANMVQEDLAPLVLRDRETRSEVVLDAAFPTDRGRLLADDYVRLDGPDDWGDPSAQRWFWTSDGREFVAPGGTTIMRVISHGDVWLTGYDESMCETAVSRWREAKLPERVMSCRDCQVQATNRGVHILRRWDSSGRELWFARDEGGDAVLLAAGIDYEFLQLVDDRVLTSVEEDESHDRLMLHDYRDGSVRTLDRNVRSSAIFINWLLAGGREVFYEVDDADRGHALYFAVLRSVE